MTVKNSKKIFVLHIDELVKTTTEKKMEDIKDIGLIIRKILQIKTSFNK